MNYIDLFRSAIIGSGLHAPSEIIADGKVHRYSANGKPNNTAGWYVLNYTNQPYGAFGDYSLDVKKTWRAPGFSGAKINTVNTPQIKNDSYFEAKLKAKKIWDSASITITHPYLDAKCVKPFGTKKKGNSLIVPLLKDNEIQSLQFIYPDGKKRFLSGGLIKGCHYYLGEPKVRIYVCEGFATAASVHEATNECTVVAFNSGNLMEVVGEVKKKYPNKTIIVCADDDKTDVGLKSALKVSKTHNCQILIPRINQLKVDGISDFNDVHKQFGLEQVLAIIQSDQTQLIESATAALSAQSQPQAWADPIDLQKLIDPSSYPINSLPKILRDAVIEVVNFVQCPVELAACSALSAASLSTQHIANVSRSNGLEGPISLYFLVIAESGERKTSADNYFSREISAWEINQHLNLKGKIQKNEIAQEVWKAELDGIKQKINESVKSNVTNVDHQAKLEELEKNRPPLLKVPRLIYTDVTPEKLGFNLANTWPSAGIFSSEAGAFFGSYAMGSDNLMKYLSMLNLLWDGKTINIDRRTQESYKVINARFSIGLAVQPETLQSFMGGSKNLARNIGFAARFLIAYPISTQGRRFFKEESTKWHKLGHFESKLRSLLDEEATVHQTDPNKVKLLKFSNEAKKVWIAFHDAVEYEIREQGLFCQIKDCASKAADNVARLSAIFHLLERGSNNSYIQEDHVASACEIVEWHLEQAKRYFVENNQSRDGKNVARLDEYIREYHEKSEEPLTQSHLLKYGPLRKADLLKEALQTLIDFNRVKVEVHNDTSYCYINPKLKLN